MELLSERDNSKMMLPIICKTKPKKQTKLNQPTFKTTKQNNHTHTQNNLWNEKKVKDILRSYWHYVSSGSKKIFNIAFKKGNA